MTHKGFKYNKKRKHYSYTLKIMGDLRENILLTTECIFKDKKKGKTILKNNIRIYKHPNPNILNNVIYYIVNHKPYIDHESSFANKTYQKWEWHKNDKRTIKRFRKYKKYKKYFENYK